MVYTLYNYYKLDLKRKNKKYTLNFLYWISIFFLLINQVVIKWSENNHKFILQIRFRTFSNSDYNTKWQSIWAQLSFPGRKFSSKCIKKLQEKHKPTKICQQSTSALASSNIKHGRCFQFTLRQVPLMTMYQLTSKVCFIYIFSWARKYIQHMKFINQHLKKKKNSVLFQIEILKFYGCTVVFVLFLSASHKHNLKIMSTKQY